jgi:hypothetical protein
MKGHHMSNEPKPGSQGKEPEPTRPEEMIEDLQPADQDAETVKGGSLQPDIKLTGAKQGQY